MSHEEIFTLAEHVILAVVFMALLFVGPGKLKQIKDLIDDLRGLLAQLIDLQTGLNGTADELKKMLPPQGDTTGQGRADTPGPTTGPPRG